MPCDLEECGEGVARRRAAAELCPGLGVFEGVGDDAFDLDGEGQRGIMIMVFVEVRLEIVVVERGSVQEHIQVPERAQSGETYPTSDTPGYQRHHGRRRGIGLLHAHLGRQRNI